MDGTAEGPEAGAAGEVAEVSARAAAKINLHLGVGAVRGDGYHPLVTVFHAVGLHDELTVHAADRWRLSVHWDAGRPGEDLPAGPDNLVSRAARQLARAHGREPLAVAELRKRIPVAGGMAGGSADAAAALVALDRLWGTGTPSALLLQLAAVLGSDVPFALVGGTALGTGRGEVLTPMADRGTWWWVVVTSAVGLSTPEVYRHFDRLRPDAPAEPPPADALLAALATGEPGRLATALRNDLQDAAVDLRPELGRLIAAGEAEGALRGLVSGSGPTCVFLCETAGHARAVAAALRARGRAGVPGHPETDPHVVSGPVRGAHVVEPEDR